MGLRKLMPALLLRMSSRAPNYVGGTACVANLRSGFVEPGLVAGDERNVRAGFRAALCANSILGCAAGRKLLCGDERLGGFPHFVIRIGARNSLYQRDGSRIFDPPDHAERGTADVARLSDECGGEKRKLAIELRAEVRIPNGGDECLAFIGMPGTMKERHNFTQRLRVVHGCDGASQVSTFAHIVYTEIFCNQFMGLDSTRTRER